MSILNFPLIPESKSHIWNIEAHIAFTAERNKPAKLSFYIPHSSKIFGIINENFVSLGYGISTAAEGENRKAVWSVRSTSGYQELYYRASIQRLARREPLNKSAPPEIKKPELEGAQLLAAEAIMAEVREKSADTESMILELLKLLYLDEPDKNLLLLLGEKASSPKRLNLAVKLLATLNVYAQAVHGIRLEERNSAAEFVHWLEVYDNGQFHPYQPHTGEAGIPNNYFQWWKGSGSLVRLQGGSKIQTSLSVNLDQEEGIRAAINRSKAKRSFLLDFSLFSLPTRTQAVYRVLLLVPLGAFLMVILRNVIGIRTFGTFMPVLIAMAFQETELIWGLILFTMLTAAGLSIRLYFEYLKLLVVPRLAAILIVVILLMATLSILAQKLGLGHGLSVALFPLVILTMTIERMSILWEELGPSEALQQGLGSLAVAALVYQVMSIKHVEHLIFVFPELLLPLLAGTLLLGRYSGFRLFELWRFRSLIRKGDDE
ncbi:inactive transglutaminase family protein [Thermodesulfobacteriota bacterium]